MTKQEIIQDEILFQRACGLWVERNIGQCVSSLMYDVGRNLEECSRIFDFDYDEAIGWFQREDYSEVVSDFIDDAGLDDLETIADMVSSWSDVIDDIPKAYEESAGAGFTIESLGLRGDDEYDLNQEALEASIKEIRTKVKALITNDSEYAEIGRHFNLDPDYDEVYEHWVVNSSWAADDLRAYGQIVFEFGGMTIFGRCATGQSISLDGWVRRLMRDLPDDHWIWRAVK